nr:uncharacterized protein LOC124813964 [Hydra vulgaris]
MGTVAQVDSLAYPSGKVTLKKAKVEDLNKLKEFIPEEFNEFYNELSSTKIVYERLDKVELRINENSKQIKLIEKEIEDIKVSLNFHDQLIEEKSRSVITSQDKCNTINVTQNNESAFSKITNKLREIEDRSRRNNLRIDGIKESEGESWNDNETKLLDFKDKVNILKKGKNIYINEDFCAETLQIRKVLRELMKMERAAGKFASISYDKLIIRDWAAKKSINV